MRQVDLAGLDRRVSALGFGCASLGSRIGHSGGVAALERAFDAGVTWFDVAPSYGDGEAETILGSFLRGRRERVAVATKVGIRPAPTPGFMRAAKPLARAAVNAVPALRTILSRARPTVTKARLDAEAVTTSVEASLRRFGTDYVDVLHLHAPSPDEVASEEVSEALRRILASGKARAVGVAGDLPAALAVAPGSPFGVVQIANNPFQPVLGQLRASGAPAAALPAVTHSVLGHAGALDRATARLADAKSRDIAAAAGYGGTPGAAAASMLMDFALAANPLGVTLVSMLMARHLDFAVERARMRPELDHVRDFLARANVLDPSMRGGA